MKLQRIIGDQAKDGGISFLAALVLVVIGGSLTKKMHRDLFGVKPFALAPDAASD